MGIFIKKMIPLLSKELLHSLPHPHPKSTATLEEPTSQSANQEREERREEREKKSGREGKRKNGRRGKTDVLLPNRSLFSQLKSGCQLITSTKRSAYSLVLVLSRYLWGFHPFLGAYILTTLLHVLKKKLIIWPIIYK